MNKQIFQNIIIGIVGVIGLYIGTCSYTLVTQPIFIDKPRTGIISYKDTILSSGRYVLQHHTLVVDYNGVKEDEEVSLATYSSFNVGDKITLSKQVPNISFPTFILGVFGLVALVAFIGGAIAGFIHWSFNE